MLKSIGLLISLLVVTNIGVAQCNGQSEICGKHYNEVAFLTTHNAFNTGSEGFSFPNHNYGIAQQLQDGVRAFMLDVYDLFGTAVVYHGSFALGSQDLYDDLGEIRSFLDANPNEVVTIILECYVSSSTIESELNGSGLTSYLYTKIDGQPWATIQEMIDLNQRLVILSDENDAGAGQEWYHYVWDHAVETHYSVSSPQDFTDDFNRGDSLNDLFIFNHFVTDATIGVGSESDAQTVNDYAFLMSRITDHFDSYGKFPNFITLDFYELGNGLQVVQDLNAGLLTTPSVDTPRLKLFPNPSSDMLYVVSDDLDGEVSIELYNSQGKKVQVSSSNSIDVSDLSIGIYVIIVNTPELVLKSTFVRN